MQQGIAFESPHVAEVLGQIRRLTSLIQTDCMSYMSKLPCGVGERPAKGTDSQTGVLTASQQASAIWRLVAHTRVTQASSILHSVYRETTCASIVCTSSISGATTLFAHNHV